ncbi:MAG: hypothetical protein ABSB15_18375 [Bryobacteraceae bacterium]|jgi:hypothetical protein
MLRPLRPFLILVFLVALVAVFTFWSQVGGQYHLDLMFWPWKFGLSLAAAGSIAAITAESARGAGSRTRRMAIYCGLLAVTIIVAGVVTYYYHLNEPSDDDEDSDQPTRITRLELPSRRGTLERGALE